VEQSIFPIGCAGVVEGLNNRARSGATSSALDRAIYKPLTLLWAEGTVEGREAVLNGLDCSAKADLIYRPAPPLEQIAQNDGSVRIGSVLTRFCPCSLVHVS
jgi:hypothetical protein